NPESPEYRSMISLRAALPGGRFIVVDGTLMGIRRVEKIIAINNFDLDLPPTEHLLLLQYADRPGVVGAMGGVLGGAGVNIAGMQVSRSEAGGAALMALNIDSAVSAEILAKVLQATGADFVRTVNLVS
ncbi:MAG: ACT domain-containing protein, partial [Actinomycetes bacterium]